MVGLSIPTIYRRIAAGRFPEQVHPADRAARWRISEIVEWMTGL